MSGTTEGLHPPQTTDIGDNVAVGANVLGTPQTISANAARRDRVVWIGTTVAVAALFLLLQNPYWVPGGDSEVYVGTAQNLVKGNGNMFNGLPMRIAPPGWPWILALVIKFVSPTFLAMKLVTLACMVAGLSVFYRVLRRFAEPMHCAAAVVLTAIISHVYSLTFWLHSDALFLLLTALTLLLSLQIAEGRAEAWRIALLLLLVISSALVRWAGVINVVIICGAMLQGELRPRGGRVWGTAALVVAVSVASLMGVRWMVTAFAPERAPFEDTSQAFDASLAPDAVAMAESGSAAAPDAITGTSQSGYIARAVGYGTWFSYLLWQPFRLATGVRAIYWAATGVGWIVAGIAMVAAWDAGRRRLWLLPAVIVYTWALCLNWPHATARYLVPIAPLLLLMIVRGVGLLSGRASAARWSRAGWALLGYTGLASVVVCNLALYGIDLWVMRSRDFYDRYEAGLNKGLISAARFLSEQRVGNWQTAVNVEYRNLNKRRMSPTGLRVLTMLTGKAMIQVPKRWVDGSYKLPNDREFRKLFIAKNKVTFYLEQPPVSPWRVWHFRMPWLQERLTGQPAEDTGAGWRVFACNGAGSPAPVTLPELRREDYPTRLPGL